MGKLAGINVLFDPDFTSGGAGPIKPQSIELNNATLEESLDYLALITKSFWKPISTNAIFVTQDNPTKRREFEEWVVKVFYLKNVTSVQEIQEIVTALRSVADIQKIFTYNAQNAIIVRAEADKIARDLNSRFSLDYAWSGDRVDFERPGVTGSMQVTKDQITLVDARRILDLDRVFGIAAGVVFVVGMVRVAFFEKGATYYWHSAPFIAKLSLFAIANTAYILVALQFEERDLIAEFGMTYQQYRRRVPMLVPRLWGRRRTEDREPTRPAGAI